MSKKVAVFFKKPGAMGYPFDKEEYLRSYQELNARIKHFGGTFYITREQRTYQGNGNFSSSWQFDDHGHVVETGPVSIDVIYDKGQFISDDSIPVFNSTQVNEVCTNKWSTYNKFQEFCPVTLLINSYDELKEQIWHITTEKKVVKPLDGEEGTDVYIDTTDNLLKLDLTYPLLLQEFLDSSIGVPGIVDGIHDFRIALFDGEVIYSFLRTPPTGQLKANVALGGILIMIPFEKIPSYFLELALRVDAKMKQFGSRFYGVDMALTQNGPKIIELNSMLGLQENARDEAFVKLKDVLAKKLVELGSNN